MSNPPLAQELSLHYDDDYHRVISMAGESPAKKRWKQQVDLISKHKQGGKLLDIGCSSGGFLGTLNPERWKLYGIEIAPQMAEKAKLATGAQVFAGDVMKAPFARNSFDVITCFDVLEHQYEPSQFLSKVRDWLKPDGIFLVVLPNIDSWESRMFGTFWYGLELPRHLFHFSPRSLDCVMNRLGFHAISVVTPPISYVERSASYCCEEVRRRLGFEPICQAKPKPANLLWKVVRKGLRLALILPFSHIASLGKKGGSMQALFTKSASVPRQAETQCIDFQQDPLQLDNASRL
jgi:SAM-dependent methyltransferase